MFFSKQFIFVPKKPYSSNQKKGNNRFSEGGGYLIKRKKIVGEADIGKLS